jgi:hypothetical protein
MLRGSSAWEFERGEEEHDRSHGRSFSMKNISVSQLAINATDIFYFFVSRVLDRHRTLFFFGSNQSTEQLQMSPLTNFREMDLGFLIQLVVARQTKE